MRVRVGDRCRLEPVRRRGRPRPLRRPAHPFALLPPPVRPFGQEHPAEPRGRYARLPADHLDLLVGPRRPSALFFQTLSSTWASPNAVFRSSISASSRCSCGLDPPLCRHRRAPACHPRGTAASSSRSTAPTPSRGGRPPRPSSLPRRLRSPPEPVFNRDNSRTGHQNAPYVRSPKTTSATFREAGTRRREWALPILTLPLRREPVRCW